VSAQNPIPSRLDISLTLTCAEAPNELAVTIRNAGDIDTAVLMGTALANGAMYIPSALTIQLRRVGIPEVEQLVPRGPAAVAGRIDHWLVELPVRASFSFVLRPADFITTSQVRVSTPPDELVVQLTGRPVTFDLNPDMTGMKAWRLRTGTARSNALRLSECAP
jgi:hypothetical protein